MTLGFIDGRIFHHLEALRRATDEERERRMIVLEELYNIHNWLLDTFGKPDVDYNLTLPDYLK